MSFNLCRYLPVDAATTVAGGDCGDATDVAEAGVSAFVGEFNVVGVVFAAGVGPKITINIFQDP